MQYLRLRRSQIILASFVSFALFITAFPAVDISISKIFFDGGSFLRDQWWQKVLQDGLGYFLGLSVLAVIGIYACNRLLKRNLCGVDGRRVVFVILVLVIGAGLIVNVILKDNFGRARPREIAEFGGSRQFTPPFVVSGQCNTNCSFSSGDAAGGFFSLALALALGRRRAMFLAGLALGARGVFLAHLLRRALLLGYGGLFLRDADRGGCSVLLPGLDGPPSQDRQIGGGC